MPQRKHRRMGKSRLPARMKVGGRTAVFSPDYLAQDPIPGQVLPTEREFRSALRDLPDDLNWEWVRPRLTPLFERADAGGTDGDPTLHAVTALGVAVGFGIEFGPMLARVTRSMAERWEASVEQIETAAFEHLERAVAPLSRRDLQQAVHRGHMLRALGEPAGWASSVILAGEEAVTRIFGAHDQVFTAPARNMLLSFDAKVPSQAIVEITLGMEDMDPHPLLLDPFSLIDGRLVWEGLVDQQEEP